MARTEDWTPRDLEEAFFPVERRSIYLPSRFARDEYRRLPRHSALIDVERDHIFAVVTDNYELVTNEVAVDMAANVMRQVFHATRMEDMACFNITMPKTRSFCHIDLIKIGAEFSPWENDPWTAFLRVTNSYNRTRVLRFELGFCRWICLNGMIFGGKSVKFSYAHTRRSVNRSDRLAETIGDIRQLESELVDNLFKLKQYQVPEEVMLPLVCRAFEIKPSKERLTSGRQTDALVALRNRVKHLTESYFSEFGPNGYAALNVLTDFATRPEGMIAPEVSMHGLQDKAARWMEDFITARQSTEFSFGSYLTEYHRTAELLESL